MVRYESLRGKRIFVTGHTGFKGSWLLHVLHFFEARVKGYALAAPSNSLFNFSRAKDFCEHVEADIREREKLKKEILEFQPDFIFHLAAQPLVLESYAQPAETFEVNQLGTIYLLDALRFLKKPCTTIIITTDKVYEDQYKNYAYRETDILGGHDPYSASKATVELSVASYRKSFFSAEKFQQHSQSVATARAGNVIGGGDFADNRIVPDIVRAISKNQSIVLRNPFAVRPWQHVLDALHGYLTLANSIALAPSNPNLTAAWNFGPQPEDIFTVEQLTQLCIAAYGKGDYTIAQDLQAPKETSFLSLDISKALHGLPWKPKWHAKTAIDKTMEWYMQFEKDPQKIPALMKSQIESFLS